MSHIVTTSIEIKNQGCLEKASQQCGLVNLGVKRHELFNSQHAHGLGIKLADWKYPAVIDLTTGAVKYDNYGGSWGKQIELDKLVQRYTANVAIEQADINGYQYYEETLENGDIKLNMTQLQTA